jgi:hypothetical protein
VKSYRGLVCPASKVALFNLYQLAFWHFPSLNSRPFGGRRFAFSTYWLRHSKAATIR